MSEIRLFIGGQYPATIVGTGDVEGLSDRSTIIKWAVDPSEPKKDRTGTVYIGKDRKIEKVVFDD